jgi:hypothetical protein
MGCDDTGAHSLSAVVIITESRIACAWPPQISFNWCCIKAAVGTSGGQHSSFNKAFDERHKRCTTAIVRDDSSSAKGEFLMQQSTHIMRLAALLILLAAGLQSASAQTTPAADSYSDSTDSTRSRIARSATEADPARLLREARTIHVRANEYIDAEYLEYKLDKLPEFQKWRLAFVKDGEKADILLEIHRTALNYIFSIVDRESSAVIVKGKVVAINGLVAAEDISKQIVKRMQTVRALPVDK